MPRRARKDLNTPFLHVMVQGVNKEYIFKNNYYIEEYLKIINSNKNEYSFTMLAYCIMNNHAHFLIYTECIKDFGNFMKKVNQKFANIYNKRENRCGVLFRNRYFSEPIYDRKYLINCIKYIHNNPVKAGMVSKCDDYEYSSYNDYKYNRGVSQNCILKEIFGEQCDYLILFKNAYERRYIDVDNESIEITKEYLEEGIREFAKENNIEIVEILCNRERLIKLIKFLKCEYKIKYVEIGEILEIQRSVMNSLQL